ncbi:hypothetical protein Trydic_g9527 [Trypoxylus dichotomus]
MCMREKKEIVCIILHVLLSLIGFNEICGQEISDHTFTQTQQPTTTSRPTFLAIPRQSTTSTRTNTNIDSSIQNEFLATKVTEKLKIKNSDLERFPQSRAQHKGNTAPDDSINIGARHWNLPLRVHTRNHDPSQKETFLGQITLNSPAELPPRFNRKEPGANFHQSFGYTAKIRSDNLLDRNEIRVKFTGRNAFTGTTSNTGTIEFVSNKSVQITQTPLFVPLYFALKATRYTIMPKNLEPLLEEPMNRKEYYKHNKQDVEVIVDTATTEFTIKPTNVSTETEISNLERNISREYTSIVSQTKGVTTEMSKTWRYTSQTDATTGNKLLDDTKTIITNATVRTIIKLPTTANTSNLRTSNVKSQELTSPETDTNDIGTKATIVQIKNDVNKRRDEVDGNVMNRKVNDSNFTIAENSSRALHQPVLKNVQNIRQISKKRFDHGVSVPTPVLTDLFGRTNDRRQFDKQTLAETIEIFLNGTTPAKATGKPFSELNGTFSKGTPTTSIPNKPKDAHISNKLIKNEADYMEKNSKRKSTNNYEMFKRNRPLALIESWSTKFDRDMEPGNLLVAPLTTLPPRRGFFKASTASLSPKLPSASIMAARFSTMSSFNVCNGKCELVGIVRLIDGVLWTTALSYRNTREWRTLAGEVQLQVTSKDRYPDPRKNDEDTARNRKVANLFSVLPPVSSTVIEYVENNPLPQWAIAVIVIGLASLFFVIIFAVTILTNRRKTSKRKTLPFTEDHFVEVNKKHILGIDNYGVDSISNIE